jgi:hypothetical protein
MKLAMEGVEVAPSIRSRIAEWQESLSGDSSVVDPNAPKVMNCWFELETTATGDQLEALAHHAARELQLQFRSGLVEFKWMMDGGSYGFQSIDVSSVIDRKVG